MSNLPHIEFHRVHCDGVDELLNEYCMCGSACVMLTGQWA